MDTDDLVLDCGLYDVCTEPTRGNNRLDKILCSDEFYFNCIERFTSTLGTDHMGLVAYHGVEQSEKKVVYFRDHRFANKIHLNYLLDTHDLSYFLNYNDPNVLLGELSNELLNLYKVACPLKRVVLSSKDPPFMTPVIKYLLRKKHRHTRRGKFAEANAVGLQVCMLITKRAFSDSSGRNWWQRVNTLLNKNTIAPDRTCAFSAEQLNQYYNGISTASGGPFKPTYFSTTNDGPQFSLLQIFNAMKRIRRTATGPDALPFWIFKNNAQNLAEIYCHMFNLCLEQCIFPEFWKLAKISHLPKVSSPKQPKDLRPVSVTSVMSRVFELLIYLNYLQGRYIRCLTRKQYGFRKHSSTSCMLIRLQHHLWNFRENYDYVRFFSLDMSKAFDTNSHKSDIEGVMTIVPVVDSAVVNVIINFLQNRSIIHLSMAWIQLICILIRVSLRALSLVRLFQLLYPCY